MSTPAALTRATSTSHVDVSPVDTSSVDDSHVNTSSVDDSHVDMSSVDDSHIDTSLVDDSHGNTSSVDNSRIDTSSVDMCTVDDGHVAANPSMNHIDSHVEVSPVKAASFLPVPHCLVTKPSLRRHNVVKM